MNSTGWTVICVASLVACGPGPLTNSEDPAAAGTRLEASITQASCPAFAVNDVAVSPTIYDVQDHEIDPIKKRLSCLESGRIVVASIDPASGLLSSPIIVDGSGKAVLSTSRMPYGNGPEWAVSQRGFELYYQKEDLLNRVSLAKAREVDGGWVLEPVPNSLWRGMTFASFNVEDPYPTLVYLYAPSPGVLYGMWRDESGVSPAVEHPATDVAFPDILGGSHVWHVPHDRSLVIVTTDSLGQQQLARHHLDTGATVLISHYPPGTGMVNMSGVTEAGPGGMVKNYYLAVVNASRIDIYAEYAGDDYVYANTLLVPAGETNSFIVDSETITHAGLPYVAFTTAAVKSNNSASADIWVAPMLASSPCELHKVSAATVAARVDPQPMTLSSGLVIFYRQKDPATGNHYLRKAVTGF